MLSRGVSLGGGANILAVFWSVRDGVINKMYHHIARSITSVSVVQASFFNEEEI